MGGKQLGLRIQTFSNLLAHGTFVLLPQIVTARENS